MMLIPKHADSFRVYFCGNCEHAHLVLIDDDRMPFAQMTISRRQVDGIIAAFEDPAQRNPLPSWGDRS